jgi:hypothetical protein
VDLLVEFDFDDYFGVPTIAVDIDGIKLYDGEVQEIIRSRLQLEHGRHTLSIRHYGKLPQHQNVDHDRHVRIRRVLFDNTDLDQRENHPLTWHGEFFPEYEESYRQENLKCGHTLPDKISPNHYLGHNGVWQLTFETPALLWIIHQQNPHGIHLEDTIFSTSRSVTDSVKDFFKL